MLRHALLPFVQDLPPMGQKQTLVNSRFEQFPPSKAD
jgi:hypothetical protein